MRVTLQREWRGLRTGRVLNMPDGQATMLRRRGIVAAESEDEAVAPAPRKPRRNKP